MHDVWCGREGSNVCDEVGGTEDAEGRWKEEKAEEINRGEEDRQQEEAKQEEAKQKEANQNAAAMDGSPQLDGVRCWGGLNTHSRIFPLFFAILFACISMTLESAIRGSIKAI